MASGETFLFNPENEGLITGEKKQPAVDSSVGCLALIMVPFVLAGLLILGLAVSEWVRLVRLWTDSAIADAHLVSQEIDDIGDSISYHVTYRFPVDGHQQTVTEAVDFRLFHSLSEDIPFEVRYVRSNPQTATIKPLRPVTAIASGLFALLWNAVVIPVAFFAAANYRRQRQLSRYGHILLGEIVSCQGRTSDEDKFTLEVTYRFRPPRAPRAIEGRESRQRDDLKDQPLPQSGMTVRILYLNPKNYSLI